jgi:hypothetical protein
MRVWTALDEKLG